MGFQYRKSKSLGGGSRLNVGKRSVGVSSGVKGARVSFNTSGRAGISLSIPKTGIRYRKTIKLGSGGLFFGIVNFFIGLMQIVFLLTWWCLKLILWCWWVMIVYACRGVKYVFRKIFPSKEPAEQAEE